MGCGKCKGGEARGRGSGRARPVAARRWRRTSPSPGVRVFRSLRTGSLNPLQTKQEKRTVKRSRLSWGSPPHPACGKKEKRGKGATVQNGVSLHWSKPCCPTQEPPCRPGGCGMEKYTSGVQPSQQSEHLVPGKAADFGREARGWAKPAMRG